MQNDKKTAHLAPYMLFYTLYFMALAVASSFINIYFSEIGFSIRQIGTLAAIGSAVSVAAQPLWGLLSDRTGHKRILIIVIAGATVANVLYPLRRDYFYVLIIVLFASLFFSSIEPLSNAFTLRFLATGPLHRFGRSLKGRKINFSFIRMAGTLSYALMAALVGQILTGNLSRMFFITAFLLTLTLISVLTMKGGGKTEKEKSAEKTKTAKTKKASPLLLFKNKMLLCVFLASFVFGVILSFHYSFIGIRLTQMGANESQVGLAMSLAAISEIPVLILMHKLFDDKKPVHILMFTGLVMGIRMLMIFAGSSVGAVYISQLLNGFTFMVPFYISVLYVDRYSPAELKATAQSVCALFRGGAAALLGNFFGGILADAIGIRGVYLLLSLISFSLCLLLPGLILMVHGLRKKKTA